MNVSNKNILFNHIFSLPPFLPSRAFTPHKKYLYSVLIIARTSCIYNTPQFFCTHILEYKYYNIVPKQYIYHISIRYCTMYINKQGFSK